MTQQDTIQAGRISGLYGVRGWVKVYSYTQPRDNIIQYSPWLIKLNGQWRKFEIAEGRAHGKGVIVRLEGYQDRTGATELIGSDIEIRREQLPELTEDEYYWSELEGMEVRTNSGQSLGVVDHLLETGANDVLVIKGERERLIPYLRDDVIIDIDRQKKMIIVDWDPDF
ncbi:MAG TPA: ribosome maturation factor RimM [Gammaproteobacteria bacterium]|nr:ribosome maturation factor RimM [Gammaproteobacteria bacterium]